MLNTKRMESEKSLQNFTPTGNCPIRDILSRLGDKWSMLVLLTLDAKDRKSVV